MAPHHVTARRSNASPSTPTGTLAERYDRGVGLRQKTPRKKHADLLGPTDRDPVAILARGDRTRVPELVRGSHAKRLRSAREVKAHCSQATIGTEGSSRDISNAVSGGSKTIGAIA